jgi:hypothetical protein
MSEARLQQECVMWFNNTFPDLRGLLCYNLNNSTGGMRGTKNKYMGVVSGRSDMVFYYKAKAYMIELKTDVGTQSQTQKEWQELIESHGFKYYIIRSLGQFEVLIRSILEGWKF